MGHLFLNVYVLGGFGGGGGGGMGCRVLELWVLGFGFRVWGSGFGV